MNISIIVPCFNEKDNLSELYKRLVKTVDEIKIDLDKIIFIDDGSSDQTWNEITNIKDKDNENVLGIKLSRNFGHQNAVIAGLSSCKSDLALIIDADLQDPPETLKQMFDEYNKEKANCVYAQRISRKDSFFKKFTATLFYKLFNKVSPIKIPEEVGDFRLIDKKIYQQLIKFPEQNPFIRGLVPWTGFKQVPIRYNRDERYKGKTGYNLLKMLNFTLDGLISFSNLPIRIAYFISIFSILLLLGLIIFTLSSYMKGNTLPGWTSLSMIILFFNCLNFFLLGLFGEYLGRIFNEIKRRPRYIISEVLD